MMSDLEDSPDRVVRDLRKYLWSSACDRSTGVLVGRAIIELEWLALECARHEQQRREREAAGMPLPAPAK